MIYILKLYILNIYRNMKIGIEEGFFKINISYLQ